MRDIYRKNESGVVSIFAVIFSALLVTIITVSFVSVMVRNQQQASNADLSNSAYDAALAGVEDAKRLLLIYRQCQTDAAFSPVPTCDVVEGLINGAEKPCNMVKRGLTDGIPANDFSEVLIQRQLSDATSQALDQAYTCVKIDYLSTNITGSLTNEESELIPIEATASFDKIRISWFKKKTGDTRTLEPRPVTGVELPQKTQWQTDSRKVTPPVLRTQWIQTSSSFSSIGFDYDGNDGQSNTKTLFLYPTTITSGNSFSSDIRTTDGTIAKSPSQVDCRDNDDYQDGAYACTATLPIPIPIDGGTRANTFLRLNAFYDVASTDYKIELLNSSDESVTVISPLVDSTGRANNLFRRVQARVNFTSENYPRAAIDIDGNLCKNFAVTDDPGVYASTNTCIPNVYSL